MSLSPVELKERLRGNVVADTGKRLDALVKLAEYHRKAMEARRTMGFSSFVAVFALNSAVLFKADDLLSGAPNRCFLAISAVALLVASLAAYLYATWQMERRNDTDRQRSACAESEAWKLSHTYWWRQHYPELDKDRDLISFKRMPFQILKNSWGSTGPAVIAILLTFTVGYYILGKA